MEKKALLIPFLIMVVLITACEKIDVSKLSDKDLERISKDSVEDCSCFTDYLKGNKQM